MRKLHLGLIAWLLCAVSPLRAQTAVELIETYPPGPDIAVPTGDTVYLRVAYEAGKPTHIWLRPYYQGREVSAGSSPSLEYSGKGELLGFFFLARPGQVDEIRVTAGDGSRGGTPEIARWPMHVASYAGAPAPPPEPAWLVGLREVQNKAMHDAIHSRQGGTTSIADIGIFGGFMLVFLGLGVAGLGWPAWALLRWRDKWRWWAAVPLAVLAIVVLRIVVDTARDPTSHNLWPFEIVMFGGGSAAAMFLISALRWQERRRID